jgi:hypothetical protein
MRRTCQFAQVSMVALILAGCGTVPKFEPEIVKVPVAVGCLGDTPRRPVNTFNVGPYPGEKAAAQAALVDAAAWEGYATGLEAAMAGCDRKASSGLGQK